MDQKKTYLFSTREGRGPFITSSAEILLNNSKEAEGFAKTLLKEKKNRTAVKFCEKGKKSFKVIE